MVEAAAAFTRDGDLFVPTELANGPWARGVLHGGPPAALLAHLCETFDGGVPPPRRVARLTVDLLRPVPLAPLRPEVRLARPGKKVDWVDASLWSGDLCVARASTLRVREAPVEVPAGVDPWSRGASGDPPFDGGPEDGTPLVPVREISGFHDLSAEVRFVRSGLDATGPGQAWIRLRHPLVAGVVTSPLMLATACADFANALSKLVPMESYSFINADLVVALWRDPVGEWIGLDAVTRAEPALGAGLAEAVLRDRLGPVGRAQQSVLLEKLEG